jgi:type IV secretory pathway TrbD component
VPSSRGQKRVVSASPQPETTSCAGCGSPLPAAAHFCPGCGRPVDPDTGTTVQAEVPPDETGTVPVHYAAAEPRYFGIAPPLLLLAIVIGAFVVAVLLFASGHWPIALILVGIAILLLTAFLELARRRPAALPTGALEGVRERAAAAVETLAVRGRAGTEAVRLRHRLGRLYAYRRDLLTAFGDAVYRGADSEQLRAQLEGVDREAQALEEELRRLVADTNERIEKARLAVQPTQMVEVPEPYPPPDEGNPPAPAPVPEPMPPPDEGTPPQPDPVPTPLGPRE